MSRATRVDTFPTIRSEGGLLPADLLARVAGKQRDLDAMTPEAYHLAPGERIEQAISRSFNYLLGAWAAFTDTLDRLPPDERTATNITRTRWLLVLFRELGFGQLQTTRPIEIDERSYPISHMWESVPIHLVGARLGLDTRVEGVPGASRRSPHALVQEFLNRSEDHLWGFVSNGLHLRLLRDNAALTRQAYVDFDLQAMFESQAYLDFAVLWLVCHQSRVEGDIPEKCVLEQWSLQAKTLGTRFREQLEAGVKAAIGSLGTGLLAEPRNRDLHAALRDGSLSPHDYYRQLLRVVYRLLFLLVAESRELLLDPTAGPVAQARYRDWYSVERLRRLAEGRRGGAHRDLWAQLRLVCRGLGQPAGMPELALPGLGSFLWSDGATPDLDGTELANSYLLDAVRSLTAVRDGGVRRRVDYGNLGPEELGSVYEALLEHHPELSVPEKTFALSKAAGNERKTTGSYYTPAPLIEELLNSALDPVLDEAAQSDDPEAAILGMTVLDPACGSGHFLMAAAHRIARRLAMVRTGDEEPARDVVRAALRDVVGRCLHGVDINEMAVELCKVNLWLDAMEPGKPLSFLDHRIVCGNSLLGTTPRLLAEGIPDAAFKALTGDDKDFAAALRKLNRPERKGARTTDGEQQSLAYHASVSPLDAVAAGYAAIDALPDDTVQGIEAKERGWRDLVKSGEYARAQLAADAWCAAFVAPKVPSAPIITTSFVRQAEQYTHDRLDPDVVAAVVKLQRQYQFLHLHLAFPDVFHVPNDGEPPDNEKMGWSGGFDVVLGNPPWERVKLQEKEFFATRSEAIANAGTAAARKRLIAALPDGDDADRELHATFVATARRAEGEIHLLSKSTRFPLTGRGDVNTYAVFTELMRDSVSSLGFVSTIVRLGIATDDTTKFFFSELIDDNSLVNLFGFENEEHIFPAIDHRETFCLLTIGGTGRSISLPQFCFFARKITALAEPERRFTLSKDDFRLINPNTRTCPVFRNRRDAGLTKTIYRSAPILVLDGYPAGNPWGARPATMFHMANDSARFQQIAHLAIDSSIPAGNTFRHDAETWMPLYEARMFHYFDHRFGTYEGQTTSQSNQGILPRVGTSQHTDPGYVIRPRHWVTASEVSHALPPATRWLCAFRDVARSKDERTLIAAILPPTAVGHKAPLIYTDRARGHLLLAALSTFLLDYLARQAVGGTSVSFFILKQLPVLPPERFERVAPWHTADTVGDWVTPRVLELTYTAWDLEGFGYDLGWRGPPFRWDEERRALLRAELDACFFHLYGIERNDVDYIMETFPIVRRKDEAAHGEYRTKRLILEVYDAMAKAMSGGGIYETVLDPPPADPSCAHPESTRPDWAVPPGG